VNEVTHRADVMMADVIILGGGLVGLTLAAALASGGVTAIVVDPADPAAQAGRGHDGRATAIASASWRMLEAIGIADRLGGEDGGCAIETIRVTDGLQPGGLTFSAEGGEPLGRMFENSAIRAALRAHAEACDDIVTLAPATPARVERAAAGARVTLVDGRVLAAPLIVAADGRRSPAREAAGIRVARWQYDHSAIVTTITHAVAHGNVAYEIFYPSGPFAILPMLPEVAGGPHRSAIVWSVDAADAAGYLGLSDRAFGHELFKRMGGFLGELRLVAPRVGWPLGFHHAATITAERLALVGDAAHGIHPIAGQGLNLGLRDVAALAEVLIEGARLGMDLSDAQLLARYERWRALDTTTIAAATDGLTRLFGIPGRAASAVRNLGMGAIDRVAPLKSLLMSEARGSSGALPRLLEGLAV
jgi:2-octaprenyl-6-methoxyphenol hydroxylase